MRQQHSHASVVEQAEDFEIDESVSVPGKVVATRPGRVGVELADGQVINFRPEQVKRAKSAPARKQQPKPQDEG